MPVLAGCRGCRTIGHDFFRSVLGLGRDFFYLTWFRISGFGLDFHTGVITF